MPISQNQTPFSDASWIWISRPKANQYVLMRRSFELSARPGKGAVDIAVDSDFVLYLNGREVGRGQFSDYPQRKTWTHFEVGSLLRRGRNVLAIMAYHRGEDFAEHRAGQAGCIVALTAGKERIVSDKQWRAVEHPAFLKKSVLRVTNQMGFTAEFDARKDLAWSEVDFDDRRWPRAVERAKATDGYWEELIPRPVTPLRVEEALPVRVVMQGSFIRKHKDQSVARTMRDDALTTQVPTDVFSDPDLVGAPRYDGPPPGSVRVLTNEQGQSRGVFTFKIPDRGVDGRYCVVDLGMEHVGLLTLNVNAPGGAVLEIAHGEHLDDGRVRAWVGGRNFADRYICREGDNQFTLPFRRLGARYLELHLSNYRKPVRLNYLGLRPTVLPVEPVGDFASSDSLVNQVDTIGIRTLHLCMHEHYEDCPWREQALYGYDSRNQALYGYYVYGNYDFAAASFELLGRGIRDDGLLELCAPAKVGVTIPVFSLVWIVELAEHWLHSGSPALFKQFAAQIRGMLQTAINRYDERTGLYGLSRGKDQWHFYEWTPGLCGTIGKGLAGTPHHAAYNLHLLEALNAYAWMLHSAGEVKEAALVNRRRAQLSRAIHKAFWDNRHHAYATTLERGRQNGLHEYTQMLALHQGIVPSKLATSLLRSARDEKWAPMTLSALLYQVTALMPRDAASRQFACRRVHNAFDAMVQNGATTLWETQYGADDFGYAGSLCHGWSALPVYFNRAWVLGVRPLEIGFKRFSISPWPGDLAHAEGSIATPHGSIRINWTREPQGLNVVATGPASLQPVLMPWPEARIHLATYNGRKLIPRS